VTEGEWRTILSEPGFVEPRMMELFGRLHARPGHSGAGGDLGKAMGYTGKNKAAPLNAMTGRLGKAIEARYDLGRAEIEGQKPRYWNIPFHGRDGKAFIWIMREELVRAFEAGNHDMATPLLHEGEIAPGDLGTLHEGAHRRISVNAYERNERARQACIEHYGTACSVCALDFGLTYGDRGRGYIHVHHLVPIASIGATYAVDPVEDLRPVCPNCHAMLHRGENLLSIEDLKRMLRERQA